MLYLLLGSNLLNDKIYERESFYYDNEKDIIFCVKQRKSTNLILILVGALIVTLFAIFKDQILKLGLGMEKEIIIASLIVAHIIGAILGVSVLKENERKLSYEDKTVVTTEQLEQCLELKKVKESALIGKVALVFFVISDISLLVSSFTEARALEPLLSCFMVFAFVYFNGALKSFSVVKKYKKLVEG